MERRERERVLKGKEQRRRDEAGEESRIGEEAKEREKDLSGPPCPPVLRITQKNQVSLSFCRRGSQALDRTHS